MRKGTINRQGNVLMVVSLMIMLLPILAIAQSNLLKPTIQFYQLTTADGLSDNYVHAMAIDKNGYLWIGTGEGLNRFNGKTVEKYFSADYPALRNDFIRQIVCDEQNRLWILMNKGQLAMIDENRNFKSIGLYDQNNFEPTRRILTTTQHDIILLTQKHHLLPPMTSEVLHTDSLVLGDFKEMTIEGIDSIYSRSFTFVEPGFENTYFYSTNTHIYIVDYAREKVTERLNCSSCRILGTWDENQILVYSSEINKVQAINPQTHEVSFPLEGVKDQFGHPLSAHVLSLQQISPDTYILLTRTNGIFLYTPSTRRLLNYKHNAADPTSLVNNSPSQIVWDSTGWVFIAAIPHGISYFNHNAVIGQQLIFQDHTGDAYDGYINNITSKDNDTYFLGTSHHLIEWKRSTNTSEFLKIRKDLDKQIIERDEITSLATDHLGQLWVGLQHSGLFVLNGRNELSHHFPMSMETSSNVLSGWIGHLKEGPDGMMWACGKKGIWQISPLDFSVRSVSDTPLHELAGEYCHRIESYDTENIWICTQYKGAWHYNLTSGHITKFTEESGLLSNNILCVNEDTLHNFYFGTPIGLTIVRPNMTIDTLDEKNGLLNRRVEALLRDENNNMWIGNDVGIVCYNGTNGQIQVFDERYGLSIQGFRVNAYYQNADGELFWGTERGLQYYAPENLLRQKIEFRTLIQRMECKDMDTYLTHSETFHLSPGNNLISFHFTTIDYSTHLRTFYQYQLVGLDTGWTTLVDQNQIRYNSLEPGTYTFKVRASNDRKTWVNADNEITIHLAAVFWERLWFKLLAGFGLLFLGYMTLRQLNQKQKLRTEALETEVIIHYFASQINKHKDVSEMLWDVAKNCISKLNLQECIIYMIDEQRSVLIQKAAYGPKNPMGKTILQPIEIPIGVGITGTVARTGLSEVIPNTEKDPRYIVDDERRYSEITVPLIIDDKIIGVIDSEHAQKNFFTQKHLSLLTAIALLTTNQIQRIQAEDEKQKARIEILQNKQKATESRLQSLRLQMNPHFLFNALNSIQQMILANEEMVATKYLSRFSKLLRSILIHSDKESISLSEELDMLHLYVELESVRFKETFTYTINCDEQIDADEIKIPTLLIQPFVENAIWHGLMHKEGVRSLTITFTEMGEYILCVIEDNGIGRKASRAMKITSGQGKKHTSKGIEVSLERLNALYKSGHGDASLEIIDMTDPQGLALGTRVEIKLPIQI